MEQTIVLMKMDINKVCRICETKENLVDLSTEEYSHLNEKLHKIADFEDKYSCWLRYICASCCSKLENAFDFKVQCEFTYKKLVDRMESLSLGAVNFSDPLSNVCEFDTAESVKVEISESPEDPGENPEENFDFEENIQSKLWDHNYFLKSEENERVLKDNKNEILPKTKTKKMKSQDIFMCGFCNWSFKKKDRLRDHIEGRHLRKKRYKCDICSEQFIFAPSRYRHRLIYHSDQSYACDMCGKSFKTKMYLNKHKKTHSETREPQMRKHLCDICGYRAKDKTHHVEHMNWHAGIKPYKCQDCGKDFVRKDALRIHRMTHTGEKPFECQICSKSFRTKAQMKAHITTHTGDRNFSCKYCDKSYSQIGGLSYHVRTTHAGEKPFQCPTCSKSFSLKHLLQAHIRIHTGERPFECPTCSKSFRSRSNQQRHRKICPSAPENQNKSRKTVEHQNLTCSTMKM
ncbi:zinc finger protein OZF-like isoform X2 [Phlebotomus papatasi]|uniref:zinc finger protein OZF-like isoform X2 n=1 Tax=Phlebotomus papatasi TaxID=29031 RepID=UPI00248457EA|nr:zinc finger protein OZF-like isoform X2 [Phlebotomus papatasi]